MGDGFSRDQCQLFVSLVVLQEPVVFLLDLVGSFLLCLPQTLKILELFAIFLLAHFILMRNTFPGPFCWICLCSLYFETWVTRKKTKKPREMGPRCRGQKDEFQRELTDRIFWLNCWGYSVFFVFCFQAKHS